MSFSLELAIVGFQTESFFFVVLFFLFIQLQAQYQDLVEWFSTINRALSPSNSFIQAVLRTENPKVNEEVVVEINSTAPLDSFVYEIMGRGNLVVARTVQVTTQQYFLKNRMENKFFIRGNIG